MKDMSAEQTEMRSNGHTSPPRVEVEIRQAHQRCWRYTWDRDQARFRLSGIEPGQATLPADLASLILEGQTEVPVAVLTEQSIVLGTRVHVRLLGAIQVEPVCAGDRDPFPLSSTLLLAEPDLPDLPPCYETLDQVPPMVWQALQAYVRESLCGETTSQEQLIVRSATEVEQRLRAARFWLKHARRQEPRSTPQRAQRDEEQAVAWRVVEELTPEQRHQLAQAQTREELVALLQPAHLIRFVPTRFQQALQHLLLDDEQLLAFLERPLLRHRTGLFGLHQYRANAGLLLLTDRQILWLRDFFSPGSSTFPEGYVARSIPLERLVSARLFPVGATMNGTTEASSPYLRLALDIESRAGCEHLEIAFPTGEESEKALGRMLPLLHAFVPRGAQNDRRARCLPVIDAWMPRGEDARRLSNLGGIVPPAVRQRLEDHLEETLHCCGDELLVSALIPALEQYRSPARLVALTRSAVLLCEESGEGMRRLFAPPPEQPIAHHRYALAQISSAQLSYSLFGSDLRLFLPASPGTTRELMIPFQSPAIAWFLPLFTRLRLALRLPYHPIPAPFDDDYQNI